VAGEIHHRATRWVEDFAHLGGFLSGAIIAALLIKSKKADSTGSFETTYYDSTAPQKPGNINFAELGKLATTQ
jgi:hypothetical protein